MMSVIADVNGAVAKTMAMGVVSSAPSMSTSTVTATHCRLRRCIVGAVVALSGSENSGGVARAGEHRLKKGSDNQHVVGMDNDSGQPYLPR
jgi:hypothetical protein